MTDAGRDAARWIVRRIRVDEWARVRVLRIEALRDPVADIAFLGSAESAERQPDGFWMDRTTTAASGDAVAQFVAEPAPEDTPEDATGDADREWIGTATVLRRLAGDIDHLDRVLDASRSDVVGVYVAPSARGGGAIDALLDACAEWARGLGDDALTLDVHVDNARAEAAYVRAGFARTGVEMTGPIGDERELRRALR